MEQLTATVTNVLVLSSIYVMVALGFAFLFNMLGILNLAHGAIYMVGGYIGFTLSRIFGLNVWVALLVTTLIFGGFGASLERLCFRPFAADFNRTVMICVAITVVLQTAVNIIVGTRTLALPPFAEGGFHIGTVFVSYERIVTFAIGAVLLLATIWFVNNTKWGQQMQAVSQDKEAAALQGINVPVISATASGIGCALAAIAGCLVGAYLNLGPFMGDLMLIKVLMIVILAGAGSIGGLFITGISLGIIDGILPVLANGAVSDAAAVCVVVVLLLIRPQGFFGHEA
jgi:branched-chain amino acid transport system permease protein